MLYEVITNDFVNIDYEIKYEILNNSQDKEEVTIEIFSKRFS